MTVPSTPVRTAATLGTGPARNRLAGRSVLVMGAGQEEAPSPAGTPQPGNGRAISQLLAREGAEVACADLDEGRAAATAQLIQDAGGRAVAIAGDATDDGGVRSILETAAAKLSGLDGLVLNVGAIVGATLEQTELSDLDTAWRINVVSQFLGLKHGIPALERGGSVVMISAVAALRIGPTPLPYDVTKAALGPLLHHGARAGEPYGVRVNMVLPGAIATPMAVRAFGGPHDLDWGREGTAWETAHAVLFLLSDDASYVNAAGLVVDGALSSIH